MTSFHKNPSMTWSSRHSAFECHEPIISCNFSCILGTWLDACSVKLRPIQEYSVLVSLLVDVFRALLPAPALLLLAVFKRLHNRGRIWRETTCGFRVCTVDTISNGHNQKSNIAVYLFNIDSWVILQRKGIRDTSRIKGREREIRTLIGQGKETRK